MPKNKVEARFLKLHQSLQLFSKNFKCDKRRRTVPTPTPSQRWFKYHKYCFIGCLCPCDRVPLLDNETSVAQKIVKIKQELLLKKDELSTIKRRKTSVLDIRPSAFALGSMLGVGIITTLVVVIAISDLPLLGNKIKLWHHKIRPRWFFCVYWYDMVFKCMVYFFFFHVRGRFVCQCFGPINCLVYYW